MERASHAGKNQTLPHRVGWLILIWLCSVLALGTVALAMRMLMKLAGMAA
ncbi:DUF2474 domain-containing protein [Dyella humicola]|nr:DUF2474 domain-containing protein [Dyella humicola]